MLDPKNIQSVTELVKQKPTLLREVRILLGMVGYSESTLQISAK